MNRVVLSGKIATDINTDKVGDHLKASARIAIPGYKKDHTDFLNLEAWDKQAEFLSQYFKKGSSLILEGRVAQQTWGDEGSKKERVVIVADRIEFSGPKETSDGEAPKKQSKGGDGGGKKRLEDEEEEDPLF